MPQNSVREGREAAAFAARLICADLRTWKEAFRAARDFCGASPDEKLVASEIRRWQALFAPDAHAETLLRKRRAALSLMRRVPELGLRLVGVVLSGAATENSLPETVARGESEKDAAITLLNAGLMAEPFEASYPTAFMRRHKGAFTLLTEIDGEEILIRVVPFGTTLPAPEKPDEWQREAEALGSAGPEELEALCFGKESECHPSGRNGLAH